MSFRRHSLFQRWEAAQYTAVTFQVRLVFIFSLLLVELTSRSRAIGLQEEFGYVSG